VASRHSAPALPPAPPDEARGSGRAKPSRGPKKRNAKEGGRAGRKVTFDTAAPTSKTQAVDSETSNGSTSNGSESTAGITANDSKNSTYAYTLAPVAEPTPSTIVTNAAEAAAKAAISGQLPEPKRSSDNTRSGKSLLHEMSDAQKLASSSQSGDSNTTTAAGGAAPVKGSRFKQKAAEKAAALADGNGKPTGRAQAPPPVKLSVFERNTMSAPLPMRCSVLPGVPAPPVPSSTTSSAGAESGEGETVDASLPESTSSARIGADSMPSQGPAAGISASSPDWRPGMATAAATAAASTAATAAAPPSSGPFLGSIEGYVPRSLDRAERAHPFLRNPFAPPENLGAETDSALAAATPSMLPGVVAPDPIINAAAAAAAASSLVATDGGAAATAEVGSSAGGAPASKSTSSSNVVVGDVAFRVVTGSEAADVVARADAKSSDALPTATSGHNDDVGTATALAPPLPHSIAVKPTAAAKKMEAAATVAVTHPPQKHVQGYDANSTDPIGAAAGGFGSGDTDDEDGDGGARAFDQEANSDDSDEDSEDDDGSSSFWSTQTPFMAALSTVADWRTSHSDAFVTATATARSTVATVSSVTENATSTLAACEPDPMPQHPEVLARREALRSAFHRELPWLRTAVKTTSPAGNASESVSEPSSALPPIPTAADGHLQKSCPICCDTIATTHESSRAMIMACQNGHVLHAACAKCLADSTCPECRLPLLATPQAADAPAGHATAASAPQVEEAAITLALANAEKLLECLAPLRPFPVPSTVLAPRAPPHADVTTAFWRLVFLVLIAAACPQKAQPFPSALFDAQGCIVLAPCLTEELGVDSAEFGALCRSLLDF